MPRIILDPFLLALPSAPYNRKQIIAFVELLLDWSSVKANDWVALCMAKQSIAVLADSQLYPNYSNLSAIFRDLGIREFAPTDILAIINDFLSRSPSLEQSMGIEDVSWRNIQYNPNIPSERSHHAFANELARLLAVLATSLQCMDNRVTNHVLATICSSTNPVHVQATIDLVERSGSDTPLQVPFEVSQNIPISTGFNSFITSLDESEMWMQSRNAGDVTRVLRIAWFKELSKSGLMPSWDSPPPFIVGADFLDTARQCGFNTDQGKITKLLARIVDILIGRNMDKCHPLREDIGGGSPHLTSGDKCAIRWDITYDYHLHCWRHASGTYEFTSVVIHNNYSI